MKSAGVVLTFALTVATANAGPSAEQLYDSGQREYDAAHYAVAVEHWQASYEASKIPLLLFNIAQAHRLNGDCVHALSSYKRFVEADPKSDQRALADEFIRELEPTCGAATQPPHPVRSNSQPGRMLRVAALVTGGGGVALAVTGLLFGRRASTLGEEVTSTCARGCDWASERDKDARGRRYAKIGYVLDAVGIAAITSGAVMYYFGSKTAVSVEPRPGDGGAVVSWSGRW